MHICSLAQHYLAWCSNVSRRPPYLAGAGTPQVDAGAQADAEHVEGRPVHQVQVEVVLQLRGVQHFEGDLGDLPGGFPRGPEEFLAARREVMDLFFSSDF